MFPAFSISTKYQEMYPGVGFGLTLISGCKDSPNPEGFDQHKRKRLRKMRKRETLVQIRERINIYADFFQRFGYDCPLTKHLKRTVNSGFPRYSLFVDDQFMAEMCAGIMVAVTDFVTGSVSAGDRFRRQTDVGYRHGRRNLYRHGRP